MINGVIKARRDKFIKEMISYGSESVAGLILAYKAAFPQCKKDESARTAGYRLIQDIPVRDAITKGLQEKEDALKKARQKEIERLAKDQIATEVELDAVLSNIVMGRRTRKKKVVVYNPEAKVHQTVTVDVEPDETSIIAAADKLYKRKGSYAEKKIQHEAGDSFIEALREMSNRKIEKANVSS